MDILLRLLQSPLYWYKCFLLLQLACRQIQRIFASPYFHLHKPCLILKYRSYDKVIPFPRLGLKANNKIAVAFPVRNLPKKHAHQLVPRSEMFDLKIAIISFNTFDEIIFS